MDGKLLKQLLNKLFGADDKHPIQTQSPRFTKRSRQVMSLAQTAAERLHHSTIEPEHMLLGMIAEEGSVASRALRNLGMEAKSLEDKVVALTRAKTSETTSPIALSPATKRLLELSVEQAQSMRHHYIGTEHLLLALISQPDSIAVEVLKQLGVNIESLRSEIIRIIESQVIVKQ